MSDALARRWAALEKNLTAQRRVVVAFSGGCDSTFLLAAAQRVLGADSVLAVTAISASLATAEKEQTAFLARRIGARHQFVETREFENSSYLANPASRCFFCKTELFSTLAPLAEQFGGVIVDGYNVSDRGDYRPGLEAARKWKVRHPLDEAGLGKKEIRALSRWLRLPTWNKPASPCLSSRVPYGTTIHPEMLRRIENAEAILHAEGFSIARVRHYGEEARIEVPLEKLSLLNEPERRRRVENQLRAVGYQKIVVDARGFRSGSLNDALPARQKIALGLSSMARVGIRRDA